MSLFEYVRRHAKTFLINVAIWFFPELRSCCTCRFRCSRTLIFPHCILADNGEQPAERMMVEVTKPLEEVASSVPGVKLVRSITGRGSTKSPRPGLGNQRSANAAISSGTNFKRTQHASRHCFVEAEQMSVAVFPIQGYSLISEN